MSRSFPVPGPSNPSVGGVGTTAPRPGRSRSVTPGTRGAGDDAGRETAGMDESPATRIGDPERNQVLEVLSRATAEGRLTMDEFSERSGAAFAAATRAELDALVADLPRDTGTLPVPSPGTYPRPAGAGTPAGSTGAGVSAATASPGATPVR